MQFYIMIFQIENRQLSSSVLMSAKASLIPVRLTGSLVFEIFRFAVEAVLFVMRAFLFEVAAMRLATWAFRLEVEALRFVFQRADDPVIAEP